VPGNAEDVAGNYYTLISCWAYGIADTIRDNPGFLSASRHPRWRRGRRCLLRKRSPKGLRL